MQFLGINLVMFNFHLVSTFIGLIIGYVFEEIIWSKNYKSIDSDIIGFKEYVSTSLKSIIEKEMKIVLNFKDRIIEEDDKKSGFRISMNSIELTGKGYGTEAIKIVLQFVFEELNLNRLQLEVFSHNLRGIRAYEKVGFVKEGVLRESLYYNGNYSDEIIMAMLKSDYRNTFK